MVASRPGTVLRQRPLSDLRASSRTRLLGKHVEAVNAGGNEVHALIVRDPNQVDVVQLGFPNELGHSTRPRINDGFLALGH